MGATVRDFSLARSPDGGSTGPETNKERSNPDVLWSTSPREPPCAPPSGHSRRAFPGSLVSPSPRSLGHFLHHREQGRVRRFDGHDGDQLRKRRVRESSAKTDLRGSSRTSTDFLSMGHLLPISLNKRQQSPSKKQFPRSLFWVGYLVVGYWVQLMHIAVNKPLTGLLIRWSRVTRALRARCLPTVSEWFMGSSFG